MVEPSEDQPSKRRRKEGDEDLVKLESTPDKDSSSMREDFDNECSLDTNQATTCGDAADEESESDSDLGCNGFPNVTDFRSIEKDQRNPMLTQHNYERTESCEPEVCFVQSYSKIFY